MESLFCWDATRWTDNCVLTRLDFERNGSAIAVFEEFYVIRRRIYQMHDRIDMHDWLDYNRGSLNLRVTALWKDGTWVEQSREST